MQINVFFKLFVIMKDLPRRDFFKKTFQKALPIMSAAVLMVVNSPSAHAADCRGSCYGSCSGDCAGYCSGSCSGSCQQTCYNTCKSSCNGTCQGSSATCSL